MGEATAARSLHPARRVAPAHCNSRKPSYSREDPAQPNIAKLRKNGQWLERVHMKLFEIFSGLVTRVDSLTKKITRNFKMTTIEHWMSTGPCYTVHTPMMWPWVSLPCQSDGLTLWGHGNNSYKKVNKFKALEDDDSGITIGKKKTAHGNMMRRKHQNGAKVRASARGKLLSWIWEHPWQPSSTFWYSRRILGHPTHSQGSEQSINQVDAFACWEQSWRFYSSMETPWNLTVHRNFFKEGISPVWGRWCR